MTIISESEFRKICEGLLEDEKVICRTNPIGTRNETMLWMLLGCLVSYLSLEELETPCFSGKPDEKTYREAIEFVLRDKREGNFNAGRHIDLLLKK
ncbi:MAG: hypothetical protein ACT4O9_11700 [Blastocatellia bacterium]